MKRLIIIILLISACAFAQGERQVYQLKLENQRMYLNQPNALYFDLVLYAMHPSGFRLGYCFTILDFNVESLNGGFLNVIIDSSAFFFPVNLPHPPGRFGIFYADNPLPLYATPQGTLMAKVRFSTSAQSFYEYPKFSWVSDTEINRYPFEDITRNQNHYIDDFVTLQLNKK